MRVTRRLRRPIRLVRLYRNELRPGAARVAVPAKRDRGAPHRRIPAEGDGKIVKFRGSFSEDQKETSTWGAAYESVLEIRTRSLRRRRSSRSRGCGARVHGWGRLCRKARRRFKHLRRRRSVPTVQGDDLSPHSLADEPVRDDHRLRASVAGTPRPWRHSRAVSATEPDPGAGREAREAAWKGSPLQRSTQGQEQGPRWWSPGLEPGKPAPRARRSWPRPEPDRRPKQGQRPQPR